MCLRFFFFLIVQRDLSNRILNDRYYCIMFKNGTFTVLGNHIANNVRYANFVVK